MAISIGSDNTVTLTGLIDQVSSSYMNAATVNGALLKSDGTSLATFTLSYVSSSNGNYRGTIPAATTATLSLNTEYQIKITATQSGNTVILWQNEIAENTQA